MKPLFEKYRPNSIDQIIGQPKACAVAKRFIDSGSVGGRAFWIAGPSSGIGKTSLARVMALTLADDDFIETVAGRDVTPAFLYALERDCRLFSFGKGGRAWIVDEAHGLPRASAERLNVFLERGKLPPHAALFFTTTHEGTERLFDDEVNAPMLLSRMVEIRLTNQGIADSAAPFLRTVAQAEGLDGRPVAEYVKLLKRNGNNLRKSLCDIEAGAMVAS